MLLKIHNLPNNITYNEVKELLWKNCGLEQIILDNLVNDQPGSKCVTVGLAEESDAAILTRKINGIYVDGHQLHVETVRQKKDADQPYNMWNAQPMQKNMATPNNPMPNMPYNMNQYAMYYGNMQYYVPPAPNAMMQQQAASNQPIYQNNIPFYQQAQTSNIQQNPVSYQQSLRISVSNTEMSKRTVDSNTFQQQNTQQNNNRNYNSRDTEQDFELYSRDRSRGRDRNDDRDRSGARDRFDKRGGDRRDRNKFHDRDQSRDRGQQRPTRDNFPSGNVWEPNQNPYKYVKRDAAYQPAHFNPSISEKINVTPQYKNEGQGYSNFANNPPVLNNPGTFKQPRPTLNKQSNFAAKGGNHNQTGNVEGKLKKKQNKEHNFTQNKKNTWQQQQRLAAPPSQGEQTKLKKTKFEELDGSQKKVRFNAWVEQCGSTIARSVMVEGNPPKKLAGLIYREMKRRVSDRLQNIYKNRYPANMIQMSAEYREKFMHEDTLEFYKGAFQAVKNEISAAKGIAAPSTSGQQSDAHIEPQQNKPAEVNKPQIKISPKPNKKLTVVKSGKLPPYPNANKKKFQQLKEDHLKEFLGCAKFDLPKLQQEALDAELQVIDDLFAEACREVDGSDRKYIQKWTKSKEYFLRTIRIHASKRLLNQTDFLIVRVYYRPKKPCVETLHDFLRRYGVISLKKSMRQKLFVAGCGNYEGYDALLKLAEYYMDGTTIRFLPLNMTGPKPEKLTRAQMRFQESNNDDYDEGEGGDDGDGGDDSLDEDELEEELIGHRTDNIQEHFEHFTDDFAIDMNFEEFEQSNKASEINDGEMELDKNEEHEYKGDIGENPSFGEEEFTSDIVVGDKNYMVLDDLMIEEQNHQGDKQNNDGDKQNNDGDKQNNDVDKQNNYGDKKNNDVDKQNNDGDKKKNDVDKQNNDGDQLMNVEENQINDEVDENVEIEAADITEEDLEDF